MRPLFLILAIAACRPPDGLPSGDDTDTDTDDTDAPGDSDEPGGGGDEQVQDCVEVCWGWNNPVPRPAPTPGLTVVEDCNASGLEPERCPDDFVCGAARTLEYVPGYATQLPVCEGQGGPYQLVADLKATPPPGEGRDVQLVFSLGGEAWPAGASGEAGRIWLVHRDTGTLHEALMPTGAGGVLDLALPEGTYDVSFAAFDLEASRFPTIARTGVLKVVTDGDEAVDVAARSVGVRLAVDGTPQPVVPSNVDSVTLTISGQHGATVVRTLGMGDALTEPVVLPYDTFDVSLSVQGSSTTFPRGVVSVDDVATVDEEGPQHVDIVLETAEVLGDVRVNGGGHGALDDSLVYWTSVNGGSPVTLDVNGTNPGRWSGRVWAGRYDVTLYTFGSGLPSGSAPIASDVVAGGRLDTNLATVSVSGNVTLNGSDPNGGYRGWLRYLRSDGASAGMLLGTLGDAEYSGVVFAGSNDVWVDGDGARLPSSARAATNHTAGGANTWNVQGWPVTVRLTVDGSQASGNGTSRGNVSVTTLDPVTRAPIRRLDGAAVFESEAWPINLSGAAVASGLLGPGAYRIAAQTSEAGGLPPSAAVLGEIDVSGPTTKVYDLETALLTIELLQDGAPLPTPPSGNRGRIYFPGGAMRELGRTGDTTVQIRLVEGELVSPYWQCHSAYGCGLPEDFQWLWTNIAP